MRRSTLLLLLLVELLPEGEVVVVPGGL